MSTEQQRAKSLAYYHANKARLSADNKAYREANKDALRQKRQERYAANPEPAREKSKQWRADNPSAYKASVKKCAHGPDIFDWEDANWTGQCYLCLKPLHRDKAKLDHDHLCCPSGKSCSYCRRGFACNNCNTLIGKADDNPDLLRLIADNLEARKLNTSNVH